MLESEAGDLFLKIVVLLAGVAKVNIVGPTVPDGVAQAVEEAFERRNGGDGPVADESDVAAVGRSGLDRTADLDGEADGLGEKDRDQD